MNFAITGVGGFVAPRHLAAIASVGGRVVAALDPHDSVGVLDAHGYGIEFFSDEGRFSKHLEELRDGPEATRLRYLTVCAPNHVHEAQCRMGLERGVDVICEKPVVLEPSELDRLEGIESATGRRVWTVLQLRGHDRLRALRARLADRGPHEVVLTYVTPRGPWYEHSWKADVERSGGLATNIGIHMFDLLSWLFGPLVRSELHLRERRRMAGYFEHERARVTWFLSIAHEDVAPGGRMQRSLVIDAEPIDLVDEGGMLHRRVYEEVLAGHGLGLADARSCILTASALRTMETTTKRERVHPRLRP